MLLCGIIDQLRPATKLADAKTKTLLLFFFCQTADPKLSSAYTVLRGLIYTVVNKQQPSFRSHARDRFKNTREPRFEDAKASAALYNIFLNILRDPDLEKIIIVINAFNECV